MKLKSTVFFDANHCLVNFYQIDLYTLILKWLLMHRLFINIFLGFFLFVGNSITYAQSKNIIIEEDLAASAEVLKVKIGTAWSAKIPKFTFGDYAVEKSKLGWEKTTQKVNLLNTKSEYKVKNKFSFVLSNKTSDSAIVNSMSNVLLKELHSFNLFSSDQFEFNVGSDEVLIDSHFFTSFITTTSNKDETWYLTLEQSSGSDEVFKNEGYLTNGVRLIKIIPTSSNKYGDDRRLFPALGYEFIEREQSIGAMQYFGGGALGYNKNMVWLKSDLEPRMKLILAAAMTSLMQLKSP